MVESWFKQDSNLVLQKDIWTKYIRPSILTFYKNECQYCSVLYKNEEIKKINKATDVHHIKPKSTRIDLVFAIYDGDERQLVPLCKKCHVLVDKDAGLNSKLK